MAFPAALNPEEQKEAVSLYAAGLSAQQVADRFKANIGAVYYALRRSGTKRRTRREANQARFETKPLSFRAKTVLSGEEERLKLAGILLYWAEGYKTEKSSGIDFANADAQMVSVFRKFLTRICQIDESRLRVLLYCYDTQDSNELVAFWSTQLHIPKTHFTKPYIKKSDEGSRGHRMRYGLVHLRYSDKKLLRRILKWIEQYQLECAGGRVVNCDWL